MGELYRQLNDYGKSDYYPYHMPGHKRQKCADMPEEILDIDITEIEGFDNLHQPEGILKRLQEKAAALYGAEESFYMVNGSTGGILSAISAALSPGGHILMARNCHKAAYHAAYLRNLTISYLLPSLISEYDIYDAVTPKQVEEALGREKDIRAVFVVSPTYEGRISDIRAIAKAVHAKGIPLIVDQAHGAHLGFEEHFALNGCQCGADIVIHSVHKTLPSMTQTALLHVNGNRIDRELLKRFLYIYQTSSPSYVLMASIDNALEYVERQGRKLFSEFAENYFRMTEELSQCRNLKFLTGSPRKQDIGKLVIATTNMELSGRQIYDILLREYHLQPEMAAGSYCLAMFTAGDSSEAYERMIGALLAIDRALEMGEAKEEIAQTDKMHVWDSFEKTACEAATEISLSEAWDREKEIIFLEEAVGRHIGEFINLYPPGVPVLVPGEILSRKVYELILSYLKQGLTVQGVLGRQEPYRIKVLV